MHAQQKGLMRELDDRPLSKENTLKREIAGEILRWFGTLRLQVTGHSMLPSVWPGDVLLIERCDFGQVSPGELVLYTREGKLFAHRMICAGADVKGPHFVTQGDAMTAPDFPVSPSEFLGRVSHIVHAGKCRAPSSALSLPDKLLASAARYSTSASRLLVHLHLTRKISGKRDPVF
jgi:hypothetical protein